MKYNCEALAVSDLGYCHKHDPEYSVDYVLGNWEIARLRDESGFGRRWQILWRTFRNAEKG